MLKHNYDTTLVIDDEVFILEMISELMHELGYKNVLTADNAKDAIKLIQSENTSIELVISDLNMPEIDGIELLRMFDEANYRGDLIILSGEDEKTLTLSETLARARNLSVLGKLAKPLNPGRLQRLLNVKSTANQHIGKTWKSKDITSQSLAAGLANSEFEPWFQPKIDVKSKQPVGVEVLARWPESAQGAFNSDDFIPAAEHFGLINELTYEIVKKAANFGKQWRNQGLKLNIAINISMDSLHCQQFADQIFAQLTKQDDRLENYVLEVTESRLIENLINPLEALLRLRMKKIKLSIDDFGTGHSNLYQLKNLPFDELKLDRSFVQQNNDGGRSQCLLEASMDIARRLDMKTVAEGVENLNDWNRLCELGCDQIQGFFIAKPMPGSKIPQWIKNWPKLSQQLFHNG